MKKYLTRPGINEIILYLYIFLIISVQYFCKAGDDIHIFMLFLFLIVSVIITKMIFSIFQNLSIKSNTRPSTLSKKEKYFWIAGVFLFSMIILGSYYLAFFPGSYSPDSYYQLTQATSGEYSDWHPVIHTLLFFTLPIKIFHSVGAIVLLQIIYFSAALSYLTYTIRKLGCPKFLCILQILFVLLAPVTGSILIHPWKDCGFAIFSMPLIAQYIEIIASKGEWLKHKKNIAAFSLFLSLSMLMRHNAILFIIPLILSLIIHMKKQWKQIAAIIICFVMITFGIKGGLYSALNADKPNQRILESVGMCMAVMGNALVEDAESLDPEVAEFLYQVAPKETWDNYYYIGSYNNVKWSEGTNNDLIDEVGLSKILDYTVKTIKTCPSSSLRAFFELTGMVWKISGEPVWTYSIDISSTDGLTEETVNEDLSLNLESVLYSWYVTCSTTILKYLFCFIGWMDLLLIILITVKIKSLKQIAYLLHALPFLCYNFGTALLLTGYDWRFFYYIYPVILPILFLMLRDDTLYMLEERNEKNTNHRSRSGRSDSRLRASKKK